MGVHHVPVVKAPSEGQCRGQPESGTVGSGGTGPGPGPPKEQRLGVVRGGDMQFHGEAAGLAAEGPEENHRVVDRAPQSGDEGHRGADPLGGRAGPG